MYEEYFEHLSEEQIAQYFDRIGLVYDKNEKPSRAYLDKIVRAQLRHIPFDNGNVWALGVVPDLGVMALFNKIIVNKRGGYCFEINGLFSRFLADVGFDCYPVIIQNKRGNGPLGAPAHCGTVAIIDGTKHFVDVGFGGNVPDGGVEFGGKVDNGHKQITDGVYTVIGAVDAEGNFSPKFYFKDCPCGPMEFVPLNYYISQTNSSMFQKMLMLNLRADDGFAELKNGSYKVKKGDEIIEGTVTTEEELKQIAEKYFGIPAENLPTRPF